MKRVAVVVQRCHPSVVGGSEALAWQYARLLASRFEVEILTSTASDYMTWNNDLAPGVEPREGIPVHRFPVEITRGKYWFELHARLMREVHPSRGKPLAERAYWREALEDEFIRFQGPYCPALEAHLAANAERYDAVVFCTYLYPTTYFGIRAVSPAKAILVPTLHDEPPAYLAGFAQRYGEYPNRIWLTDSEQRVARRLAELEVQIRSQTVGPGSGRDRQGGGRVAQPRQAAVHHGTVQLQLGAIGPVRCV